MHVDRRRELLGVSDLWEERVGRARQIICQLIAPPRVGRARQIICQLIAPPRLSFPFIIPAYIVPISLFSFQTPTRMRREAPPAARRGRRVKGSMS